MKSKCFLANYFLNSRKNGFCKDVSAVGRPWVLSFAFRGRAWAVEKELRLKELFEASVVSKTKMVVARTKAKIRVLVLLSIWVKC